MGKYLYIIRHGETEYNHRGMIQGQGIDADLNAHGQEQAKAFFKHYKHVPFDKVYTSALKRTHQSVAQFIEAGIPWEQHAGLNEISWGVNEGKAISPETDKQFFYVIKAWQAGVSSARIEGGESPDDVLARQIPVMDLIMSRPEEKNVLICMHGRAMRVLLCHLTGRPLKDMDLFEHRNLCLYLLEQTSDRFQMLKANYREW